MGQRLEISPAFGLSGRLAGVVTALLGVVVVGGWITRTPEVVQLAPGVVPMQVNTALGLVAIGLALALRSTVPRVSLALGGLSSVLGLATLAEYWWGIEVGIDQPFGDPFITTKTSHPGRMGPNTALCFALGGVGVALLSLRRTSPYVATMTLTAALLVLALASYSIVGYLLGFEAAYGWGGMTRMAPQTALGFLLACGGILASEPVMLAERAARRAVWAAAVLFAATAAVDLAVPVELAAGVAYAPTVLFAYFFRQRAAAPVLASVCTALILLDYFADPPGEDAGFLVVANALLAIIAVWVTAGAVFALMGYQARLDRSREEAEQAKERLEHAFNSTADGLWEWDLVRGKAFLSPRFKELLGFGGEDVPDDANWVAAAIHPDDFGRVTAALETHFRDRVPFDEKYRLRTKSGSYRWHRCRGQAVWDEEGRAIRMVGSTADIDAAMRGQLELERSEARLQALLDATEAIVFMKRDGRYLLANRKLHDILGRKYGDIIGRTDAELFGPGSAERLEAHAAAVSRADAPIEAEETIVHADGSRHVYACTLFRIFDSVERDPTLCGIATDVTALKEARERAEETNRLKTAFLANVSHEIRTPLNGVIGFANLLARTDLTEKQQGFVETIQSCGQALHTLLNDIIDISKIEAGMVTIEEEELEPSAIVHTVAHTIAGLALEKNIRIEIDVDPGAQATFVGDPRRLQQVLANLASNAVKFTDEGRVTLRARYHEGRLRFEVEDTGMGIAADQKELIFERFRQGDGSSTRKHGGVGLGLAIAKDIVGLLGGRIGVESEPGRGSIFWFETAPCRPATAPRPPMAEPAVPIGEEQGSEPAGRILLAEDNFVNQQLVLQTLEPAGYTIDVVGNGAAVLERLAAAPYDLVLMDIQMPVMNGDEAVRRIRASDESWAGVPIIVLTANAMTGAAERYLRDGANAYLSKPVSPDLLAARAADLMRPRPPAHVAA